VDGRRRWWWWWWLRKKKIIIDDTQIGHRQMPTLDLGVSCRADSVPGHSVCIPSV